MSKDDVWSHEEVRELFDIVDEIEDAIEVVGLYSKGFERSLCDTQWAVEATDLNRAAERAANLVARLQSRWNG